MFERISSLLSNTIRHGHGTAQIKASANSDKGKGTKHGGDFCGPWRLWMPPPAEAFRHSWKLTANLTISRKSAKKHATGSLLRVWVDLRRNPAKIPLKGIHSERPFKNVNFCLSSRKAIILTTGIHWVFRGLKFEPDAEIEQKGAFFKGLPDAQSRVNRTLARTECASGCD
jgi:hypothetical protein